MIRSPILCLLGHVDHGKTTLADKIRGTAVAKREVGGITQMIGASFIPTETIREICGGSMKFELKIPGLLLIDTPGHEAFTNLRKRGGSMADLAVLIVDIMQGFQPQTLEAIEILREYKTPFVVAANKIDLLEGWKMQENSFFSASFAKQRESVQEELDKQLYSLIGRLHELGFPSERFDRVNDFTKEIAIVPVSAKSGEGIPELLMFSAGLSQKYMGKQLDIEVKGAGKGNILEVKEERGLGKTVDVILYDGSLKKNDIIVFGTTDGNTSSTKVRALLRPKPLNEMRDPQDRFDYVDEVWAACGVKIFAPGLEDAVAGSLLLVASETNLEELKEEVKKEIADVFVSGGGAGVILKADTIGSVEALTKLLLASNIIVKEASIGKVGRKDVINASAVKNENKYLGVILAFNTPIASDAETESEKQDIPIISSNIIYALIDTYKEWVRSEKDAEKKAAFETLTLPAKIKVLPNFCFRASHPAIFGVEVLIGRIRTGYEMKNSEGVVIGEIKSIQAEKESVQEASKGMQVAISMAEPTFGRQVNEKDVLFSVVPKEHARLLKEKYKEHMNEEELKLLEEK
ncbi:MAG: translation initiation factor IF-2 [Candidatus Micrarchaeota archaeon]